MLSSHVGDSSLGELSVEGFKLGEAQLRGRHAIELGDLVDNFNSLSVAPPCKEELGRFMEGEDDKTNEEDQEGDASAR